MIDRKGQFQISDIYNQLGQVRDELDRFRSLPRETVTTPPSTTPGQAANQIRNGSFAHSVNSWAGNVNGTADIDYECAYWFSHADTVGTAMTLTTSGALSLLEGEASNVTDFTNFFLLMGG